MKKTIVALSTPTGRGAIAIVRMSGDKAVEYLNKAFTQLGSSTNGLQPNMLTLGNIELGGIRDRVMAVIFRAPKSYTGEDMAEVHCHGSPEISERIIRGFIGMGASAAEPGEFTKRAFLNGKITLDEAEAVGDIINAQSEAQINAAYTAVLGKVNGEVTQIYNTVLSTIGAFEAAIDYPEEDVEEQTADEALAQLNGARASLKRLIESYGQGEKIRGGVRVAIVGVPNAGKSSLLNCLLGRERAIVTANAGTTRDTIEESYEYKGMLFTLVDTAGLRAAEDEAEAIGVKRSAEAAKTAHIVLRVTDLSAPVTPEVQTTAKVIDVYNKSDLAQKSNDGINISAKTGEGIEKLKETIYNTALCESIETGGAMLTSSRHYDLACSALTELDASIADIGVATIDCALVGLRNALRFLGEITGVSATDDVINEIFSKFCVGK